MTDRQTDQDARDTTHWEADDPPDVDRALRLWVDDNVYAALCEFGRDITPLVGEDRPDGTYDPDRLCLYLAEGRKDEAGKPTDISTVVSLRETILEQIGSSSALPDGAIHPEECLDIIAVAENLEGIAKELRARVERAQLVTHLHTWTISEPPGDDSAGEKRED